MRVDNMLDAAKDRILSEAPGEVSVGIILGSGLGDIAAILETPLSFDCGSVPGFPTVSAPGHAGTLLIGRISGIRAAVMSGRPHLYEGYDRDEVTYPVRLFGQLGARTLIVTNAAGAVNRAFRAGDLMFIKDHIDMTLTGSRVDVPPAPFFRRGFAYDRRLLDIARCEAQKIGLARLQEGVYATQTGPSYETEAEMTMLETIGADAVGMSTAPEATEAFGLGMRVLGVSCIANPRERAHRLTHEEVERVVQGVARELGRLLTAVLSRLDEGNRSSSPTD